MNVEESMHTTEIAVSTREANGKSGARKARRDGRVPGILYSKSENMPLSVSMAELSKVLRHVSAGNAVLDVKVDDGSGMKALIKEIQRDPITGSPLHFDFIHIEMDHKVKVRVPIHFVGTSPGVKMGGSIQQVIRELHVECVASEIPDSIDIDISHLNANESIHVKDVNQEGIRVLTRPELVIMTIVAKKKDIEAAEGAEAAEGGGEGDAPAEGGSEG